MRMPASTFKDLVVWQKAHQFVLILAHDLGYGAVAGLNDLLEETSKLLEAYSGTIQSAAAEGHRAHFQF